jgi:hypothetical protein
MAYETPNYQKVTENNENEFFAPVPSLSVMIMIITFITFVAYAPAPPNG